MSRAEFSKATKREALKRSGGRNSVHVCKKAECRMAHDRLHAESGAHLNVGRTYTPLEMLERVSHLNSFRELNAILPEIRALLACSSEPISAGSRPNNSSGADRDAVIDQCIAAAEEVICADCAATYPEELAGHVAERLSSLKSPPTVGGGRGRRAYKPA